MPLMCGYRLFYSCQLLLSVSNSYFEYGMSRRIRFSSLLSVANILSYRRFHRFARRRRRWLFRPLVRLSLPVLVKEKRLAAPLWVLIFGKSVSIDRTSLQNKTAYSRRLPELLYHVRSAGQSVPNKLAQSVRHLEQSKIEQGDVVVSGG